MYALHELEKSHIMEVYISVVINEYNKNSCGNYSAGLKFDQYEHEPK